MHTYPKSKVGARCTVRCVVAHQAPPPHSPLDLEIGMVVTSSHVVAVVDVGGER